MGTVANPPATSRLQQQLTQLPLMWFSLAFLAGIILASLISLSIWTWAVLSIFFLALALFIRYFPLSSLRPYPLSFLLQPFTFILFFALFLGAARYQLSVPKFDAFHIAYYNDRDYDLLITGTLAEPPDYRDN